MWSVSVSSSSATCHALPDPYWMTTSSLLLFIIGLKKALCQVFLPYPQFNVSIMFCQSTNSVQGDTKWFCFLKEIPFWYFANVFCRYFLLCPHRLLYRRTCLVFCHLFLGVGLCLCFKLKRLTTSELWTSTWPTWVQVGSLIIIFWPTLWCTIIASGPCVDVPGRHWAQWRKEILCIAINLLFCIWSVLILLTNS